MTRLIIPGLNGSGPDHWQRRWLDVDADAHVVEQDDWDRPQLQPWLARLEQSLDGRGPYTLVAHSLGAILVAHVAARRAAASIAGALLVAPVDVDGIAERFPAVAGFAPAPVAPLPFPAIVVASRNDPYMTIERSAALAAAWGADFVDAGFAGHINAASGHGPWPEGFRLLASLTRLKTRLAA